MLKYLPTKKDELWKKFLIYNVKEEDLFFNKDKNIGELSDKQKELLEDLNGVVFIDGIFQEKLSMVENISIKEEKLSYQKGEDFFRKINHDNNQTYYKIKVSNTKTNILFLNTLLMENKFVAPRILVEVNGLSEVNEIHNTRSLPGMISNVIDYNVNEDSDFKHNLHINSSSSYNIRDSKVNLYKNSKYNLTHLNKIINLSRNNIIIDLYEGSDSKVNGIAMGTVLCTNSIYVCHNHIEKSSSNADINIMLNHGGTVDYRCRANVNVAGVEAYQHTKGILEHILSKKDNKKKLSAGKIHAVPELFIFNNDVACSHGLTIGELDDEKIFYLMQRGISEKDAKALLFKAFFKEMYMNIDENDVVFPLFENDVNEYVNFGNKKVDNES